MMSFAHPVLAWATAGLLVVPPLIHWLARRRARHAPWAAMRFLLAAQQADRSRRKIKRWLLMLIRIAALACVGLALARPNMTSTVLAIGQPRTHLVLLIDDSLSMSAVEQNAGTRFDRAVETAKGLLADHDTSAPISILTTTRHQPIVECVADHRRAYDALETLAPTAMSASMSDSVRRARDLIARHPATPAQCVILTDLAGDDWVRADHRETNAVEAINRLSLSAPSTLIQCSSDAANSAIVSVNRAPRGLLGYPMVGIDITVANFSDSQIDASHVELLDNQRIIRRVETSPLSAGEMETITAHINASAVRSGALTARLATAASDALAADDVRLIPMGEDAGARALIVTDLLGESNSNAVYLRSALAPVRSKDKTGYWSVTTVDAATLRSVVLDEYDLVIFHNVRSLTEKTWSRLRRYLHGGGGCWHVPGDRTDFEHFNVVGFDNGDGALAASFRVTDSINLAKPLRIDIASLRQSPLSRLASFPDASLFRAHINRYVRINSAAATVWMRMTNGDPLLVTRNIGLGRSALLATATDMAWTNLPAKGDFVSLVQELADWLKRDRQSASSVLVGQTYSRRIQPNEASSALWVRGPDSTEARVTVERQEDHLVAVVADTSQPGAYSVGAPGAQTTFVANVDAAESNIRPANDVVLGETLREQVNVITDSIEGIDHRKEHGESSIAMLLAHAGLLILVGESLLSSRISRAQKTK